MQHFLVNEQALEAATLDCGRDVDGAAVRVRQVICDSQPASQGVR